MENFKTISTSDIRKKSNKISFISPLKLKTNINKNHYIPNLKLVNSNSSELDIFNRNKLFPKNIKTLTIEEYDRLQNNSLNKYKSKGIEGNIEKTKTERKNENSIQKNNNPKNNNIRKLSSIKSDSKILIKSIKLNYENPKQSLKIINSNNNIFNSISKGSLLRQQLIFDNSVKIFENFAMKFKTKMPKIKMSSINSKIADYMKKSKNLPSLLYLLMGILDFFHILNTLKKIFQRVGNNSPYV